MAKKLFLTGGAGMVGRNLQEHAAAADWDILAPRSQDLDLTDAQAVTEYVAQHQPDLVVHAAGKVGGIAANMAEPVAFLDLNTMIGRNVIMATRNAGVKRLINLGSTCIYPRAASNPLTESMILHGELEPTNEGYAIAKIFALRLCEYISREDPSFLYKTLIPCNLFGPYDKFNPKKSHLLPAIIRKIHDAQQDGTQSVEIWGDGEARREFMYAADLADAIFCAAEDLKNVPDQMNVGIGDDHTINEYYETVARVIGWEGSFTHNLTRPVGMLRKLSDTSRLTAWGWKPKTPLEEGIAKTYAHFLEIKP
ncbi:MAG: GDP-L-fucose synthase [Reinekea sp.]|jgi:GDP-L-fucose synthase